MYRDLFEKRKPPTFFSDQASLSCRVQRLLLDNFPEEEQPAEEVEEEVLSLGGLLHAHQLPESEEKGEEMQPLCPTPHW